MTEALGTEKGERTPARLGHRSGYYGRTLVTRVGKLELRVPQDRHGRFSTELFERYQRSEKALVAALAEMYVQGVSTRKVKTITEELCGHSFSAAAISAINARLDEELAQFADRRTRRGLPLSDRRHAVRAGSRRRHHPQPGGAAGDRHQLGRPPQRARDRARQPREPLKLARLPARAPQAWLVRRRVRGVGRPCRAPAGDRRVLPEAAWQSCYVHFLELLSDRHGRAPTLLPPLEGMRAMLAINAVVRKTVRALPAEQAADHERLPGSKREGLPGPFALGVAQEAKELDRMARRGDVEPEPSGCSQA